MGTKSRGWIAIACVLLMLPAGVFASGGGEKPGTTEQKPVKLVMWWWGESEAPGMDAWVKETVEQFQAKNPSIHVETVLQAVDNVINDFTTASAAGNPPDLQYLWNGMNHMENVWRGYLEPLNNWFTEPELKAMGATELSLYQGKQYRVGWYVVPFGMIYNKKIFAKVGIPNPPEIWEWEDFIAACKKIKQAGITPLGFGFKDGWFGEWYTAFSLIQQIDSLQDAAKLVSGENRWADPRWHEIWTRLDQLIKAGYVNDDANSLAHYQGVELFNTEKAAMTTTVGSLMVQAQKSLGAQNVGLVKFPRFGKGAYSKKGLEDIQGIGISSLSKNKKEAADFIRFMHTPPRLTAMFLKANVFPADTRWDGDATISDANLKIFWRWFKEGPSAYLPNMIPWTFDEQVEFTAPQNLMAATHTAAEMGKMADDVMARWRAETPDLFVSYKKWFELK